MATTPRTPRRLRQTAGPPRRSNRELEAPLPSHGWHLNWCSRARVRSTTWRSLFSFSIAGAHLWEITGRGRRQRHALALSGVVSRCYCYLPLIGACRCRLHRAPRRRVLALVDLGVPLPSQIRWCLLPVFRRSTGDGPVAAPPFSRGRGSRLRTRGTSRVRRLRAARRAGCDAVARRRRPSAIGPGGAPIRMQPWAIRLAPTALS